MHIADHDLDHARQQVAVSAGRSCEDPVSVAPPRPL